MLWLLATVVNAGLIGDIIDSIAKDIAGSKDYTSIPASVIADTTIEYILTPNETISTIINQVSGSLSEEHSGTVEECQTYCNEQPWCKSFDYVKTQNKCVLSNLNDAQARKAGGRQSDVSVDHYRKRDDYHYQLHFTNSECCRHTVGAIHGTTGQESAAECQEVCNYMGSKCQYFSFNKELKGCNYCDQCYFSDDDGLNPLYMSYEKRDTGRCFPGYFFCPSSTGKAQTDCCDLDGTCECDGRCDHTDIRFRDDPDVSCSHAPRGCAKVRIANCKHGAVVENTGSTQTQEFESHKDNCIGAEPIGYSKEESYTTEVSKDTGFELSESVEDTVRHQFSAELEVGAEFEFGFGSVSTSLTLGSENEWTKQSTRGQMSFQHTSTLSLGTITGADSGTVPPGMKVDFFTSAKQIQWEAPLTCTLTCYEDVDGKKVLDQTEVTGTMNSVKFHDATAHHNVSFCGGLEKCFADGENCKRGHCPHICKSAGCGGAETKGRGYICKSESDFCECGNEDDTNDVTVIVKDLASENLPIVIGSSAGVLLVLCLVVYCMCQGKCCCGKQKVVYASRGMA